MAMYLRLSIPLLDAASIQGARSLWRSAGYQSLNSLKAEAGLLPATSEHDTMFVEESSPQREQIQELSSNVLYFKDGEYEKT